MKTENDIREEFVRLEEYYRELQNTNARNQKEKENKLNTAEFLKVKI